VEATAAGGTMRLAAGGVRIGAGLVALILGQRLGIIVRDSASTILRQQAWVVISKQVMRKLPSVPYPLFENNAFQARYGLVIREYAQRSITLVDSLLSTVPILLGLLGIAVTLFILAPWLVLALLALFALIGQGQISLPNLAVIMPGLALLSGMTQSLIYIIRSLGESLYYAAALFDFLAAPFGEGAEGDSEGERAAQHAEESGN